jgi:hypothetical protein
MFATVFSISVNATLLTPHASSKAQHASTSAMIIFGLKMFLLSLSAVLPVYLPEVLISEEIFSWTQTY